MPEIWQQSRTPEDAVAHAPVRFGAAVRASFDNADDPRQVAVDAEITAPDGHTSLVPGFRLQDFRTAGQAVVPDGEPQWTVRYTPLRPGRYRYRLLLRSAGQQAATPEYEMAVAEPRGAVPGFVRVDLDNPAYLSIDSSGRTFFPMGVNLDVPEFTRDSNHHPEAGSRYHGLLGDGIEAPPTGQSPENLYRLHQRFSTGLERLAAAGGNAARIILDSWWLPLEMRPDYPAPGYPDGVPGFALGRYNAANAWLVDRIVDLAGRHGIRLTLVFWDGQGDWGGPAYALPATWDEDLVHRRVRYQVARWGHAPQVAAWELFNEADIDPRDERYLRTVAQLRSLDANRRPVLNSWDGIDARETHYYPCGALQGDPGSRFYFPECPKEPNFLHIARFEEGDGRPHLLSEYGEKWYFRLPLETDSRGLRAHEGLWAALMGGLAGAQYWWFHGHLYPADGFEQVFRGPSGYLKDLDLARHHWAGARFTEVAGPGGLECRGMVRRDAEAPDADPDVPAALLWFVRTPSHEPEDRPAADGNRLRVTAVPADAYRVQWWDTWSGRPLRTEPVEYRDGGVVLDIPDGVTRDIAAKVLRTTGGGTHPRT